MAFPTTSVLDDFNRANSASLGANWTNPVFTGNPSPRIVSNAMGPAGDDSGTVYCDAYWSASTFGPDSECWVTVSASNTNKGREIYVRLTGLDGSPSGYSAFAADISGTSNNWTLNRYDNGTFVQLGAAFTQSVAAGDSIGLEMIGSSLVFYYKAAAGSWASVTSRTDATYSGAGNIALALQQGSGTSNRFDDFGGGTVVVGGGGGAAEKIRIVRSSLRW